MAELTRREHTDPNTFKLKVIRTLTGLWENLPDEIKEKYDEDTVITYKKRLKNPNKGKPVDEATKAKISKALKGRVLTKDHANRISAWRMGRAVTPEVRANMIRARQARADYKGNTA